MRKSPLPKITRVEWMLLAIVFALGATVRLVLPGSIPPGLWYDEAIYALDGLSIGGSNWPIFFTTEGHPREPLYIYYLGGFFTLFGHSIAKARVATALWGIATLPLFFSLARRPLGTRWAIVAMLVLSVFRWHLHFSRTIFRALLPSFFIVAVVLFFLRWRERRRPLDAALCGAFLGLGMYTYLSFRLVPILLLLWIAWLVVRGELSLKFSSPHLVLMVGCAMLAFSPLAIDYVIHPFHFRGRTDEISLFSKRVEVQQPGSLPRTEVVRKPISEIAHDVGGNALAVAKMWTIRGDHVGKHNLPYAPVFDWASGLVFYAGILWCFVRIGRDQFAFLSLAWIFMLSLTSVFSFGAPNLLRMQGMTPAVALVYVIGLKLVHELAMRRLSAITAHVIVASLLVVFASIQLFTYFVQFPRSPGVQKEFQKYEIVDLAKAVQEIAPAVERVYVPEEMAAHPSFAFVTYGIHNVTRYTPEWNLALREKPAGVLVTARSIALAQEKRVDLLTASEKQRARTLKVFTIPARPDEGAEQARWAELWRIE